MTVGRSWAASGSASSARALLSLLRPQNGAIAAGAVVVGAWVSRRPPHLAPALWGGLAALAASSAANALNDVVDLEADRANRPGRPLPAGLVTRRAATAAWVAGYAVALAVGLALGPEAAALVGLWIILTALYTLAIQRVPLLGNAVASLVASSAFVLGGITQGATGPSFVPFALAFLANAAREVVKDVEDAEGDAAVGNETFAVVFGARASLNVARGLVVVLALIAAAPIVAGLFGSGYAAFLVPIEAALVWLVIAMARPATPGRVRLYSNLLKVVMVAGVFAVLAGVLTA